MILVKAISEKDDFEVFFGIQTQNTYEHHIGHRKERWFDTFTNASRYDLFCFQYSPFTFNFYLQKKGIYFDEHDYSFEMETVFDLIRMKYGT
jgi:hypothetical protein